MNQPTTEKAPAADSQTAALMRLVDPRIPLPWLITVIVLAASMWFKLQSLTDAVLDMQITVKAGNQSWQGLASEQALLKFRASNAEADIERLKAAIVILQARKP